MKRPVLLFSILTYFSVSQIFAQGDHEDIGTPSPYTFHALSEDLRDKCLCQLSTRDRINLGAASKHFNEVSKELNNRVFMIDGSRKKFNDLKNEDFPQIRAFNDFFYIGIKYLDKSDQLRMWVVKKCIKGIAEINACDHQSKKDVRFDQKFYLDVIAMKPLEIDEDLSLQERLIHLANHLTIENLSEISGKEISVDGKSHSISTFYEDILELGLIEDLDVGANAAERLANLLVNQVLFKIWQQVGYQVMFQVQAQIGAKFGDPVCNQVWERVEEQVGVQVGDPHSDGAWDEIWDQFWSHGGSQASDQIVTCLLKYDFKLASDMGNLNETLKLAIDSAFIAYQVTVISSQKYSDFKNYKRSLSENISNSLSPLEIDTAIDEFEIPLSDLPVINTYLELLRRSKAR